MLDYSVAGLGAVTTLCRHIRGLMLICHNHIYKPMIEYMASSVVLFQFGGPLGSEQVAV